MASAPVNTPLRAEEKPGWMAIAFIAAFVLMAVMMFVVGAHLVKRSPGPEVSAVAVLPFSELGPGPRETPFAALLAHELEGAVERAPALHLAPAAQAATLLVGSVQRSGDRVRLATRLERASDRRILWSHGYEFAARDSAGVEDEIVRAVLSALHLPARATTRK